MQLLAVKAPKRARCSIADAPLPLAGLARDPNIHSRIALDGMTMTTMMTTMTTTTTETNALDFASEETTERNSVLDRMRALILTMDDEAENPFGKSNWSVAKNAEMTFYSISNVDEMKRFARDSVEMEIRHNLTSAMDFPPSLDVAAIFLASKSRREMKRKSCADEKKKGYARLILYTCYTLVMHLQLFAPVSKLRCTVITKTTKRQSLF